MAVLTYCIAESGRGIQAGDAGVLGAKVQSLTDSGLECFFSECGEPEVFSARPIREAALAFHAVLRGIFAQTAIIPFRFPTILPERGEISGYLQRHASEYAAALDRLRDKVQMDVRIGFQRHSEFGSDRVRERPVLSGAAYMRGKQAERGRLLEAARSFRLAGGQQIEEWREREVADGLRCFILAARSSVEALRGAFERLQISAELTARVSGPWPAAEFIAKPGSDPDPEESHP